MEINDALSPPQAFLRECEENLPIFDKMSTEAGYLMEQPNMARELDGIQKRWGGIISSSEERSHRVEKMFRAWTAYSNELESFQENLDRLQNRLASDPNVGTTDVQVLEHELALAKVRAVIACGCCLLAVFWGWGGEGDYLCVCICVFYKFDLKGRMIVFLIFLVFLVI